MKPKTLSHWILLIAIACLVGQSLIELEPSKAKIRRPYFYDYPLPNEYSDAHDKYIVEQRGSIYPIRSNNTARKTKRKLLPATTIYQPSTYLVLLYIIRNSLLLFVLDEIQETLVGISYLWLHFIRFLQFANPFTTTFDMTGNQNCSVCVILQFASKRMFLTKMFTFAIEPNGLPNSKNVEEIFVDDEITFKKPKEMANSTQGEALFDFPNLNKYISESHGESHDGKGTENGMNDSLANAVPPPPPEFADSFLESHPVSDHGKDFPSEIVTEADSSGSTGVKIDDCGEFMSLIYLVIQIKTQIVHVFVIVM